MNQKNIMWNKSKSGEYHRKEYNDESMATLSLFFEDGLPFNTYLDFLKNDSRLSMSSNLIRFQKKDSKVTLTIFDYIFQGMVPFETSILNMITIIEEYARLESHEVDTIEIVAENDQIVVSGY